jgi:hypothetical protein
LTWRKKEGLQEQHTMTNLANIDENPCCRVCHGESEPNNQLYYPCKCDGSIKYVHQECLLQWLKISRKKESKCELCGEFFTFHNVYADGAPSVLTWYEITMELIPRLFKIGKFVFNILASCFFWGFCLPLFTNWWVKYCWCSVSDGNCASFFIIVLSSISIEHITVSWYSGIVDICVIIAISVISFEIAQVINKVFIVVFIFALMYIYVIIYYSLNSAYTRKENIYIYKLLQII